MYTPLFIHSSYSLLSSTISIQRLVNHLHQQDFKAAAITDTQNMCGAMEFSLACAKKGIKAILASRVQFEGGHELLIYCKNSSGYQNLSYIISQSYEREAKAMATWDSLRDNSDGLIVIVAPSILNCHEQAQLTELGEKLEKVEWYVGLEPNQANFETSAYLSGHFDKPVVAVSPTYFLNPDEEEAHDVLLCIKNQTYLMETDRARSDPKFGLIPPGAIAQAYEGFEFAVENTNLIADLCNYSLLVSDPKLPRFYNEDSKLNEIEELTARAKQGLSKMEVPAGQEDSYQARLEFELDVITRMGFAGYFMIVSDFITFARKSGIPVSIRGSGAGSLVARCIDITEIDPIKFELFFERFLNPGRVSMPDFDVDFSPGGREKVIEYVVQKYGKDCVSGIITFGTLSSRAVLKDVGRVLHIPYTKLDELSKRVQVLFGRPFTLEETYKTDQAFAEIVDADEMLSKAFALGKQLEGLFRHASAHAAGIIITDEPIYKTAPLYRDSDSHLVLVQFSMKYAELAGLIKFDFLGVTALDIIADTLSMIKPIDPDFDLYSTSLDDQSTFAFLRTGHTRGVFQFETPGMTKLIRDMEADCIEDLIATVSLYRPGPMDNIPLFIRCKKGTENITYIYPELEPILANTYGIIVYQEQILRIVQDIAGYTLSEADLLRRAIGKKIPEEMAKHKEDFISRTVSLQGGDISKAEDLFKLIETFANYGFNKAHAAAYAIVGYRGAYLKTHYPIYFICASMTAEQNDTTKLAELIFEARSMNIEVDAPCINKSDLVFRIQDKKILFSLAAIKNIGNQLAKKIIENRPYSSVADLLNKVSLNKREVESLTKSGAMDSFSENRGVILQIATLLLNKNSNLLFDPILFLDREANSWSELEAGKHQRDILGLYLDKHPLDDYFIENLGGKYISRIDQSNNFDSIETAGLLEKCISKVGKKGDRFYLANFSDRNGYWEALVSNKDLLEQLNSSIGSLLWCNVQISNGRIKLKAISAIEDKISAVRDIYIKVNTPDQIYSLRSFLAKYKAEEGVGIYIVAEETIFVGNFAPIIDLIKELRGFQWKARY